MDLRHSVMGSPRDQSGILDKTDGEQWRVTRGDDYRAVCLPSLARLLPRVCPVLASRPTNLTLAPATQTAKNYQHYCDPDGEGTIIVQEHRSVFSHSRLS